MKNRKVSVSRHVVVRTALREASIACALLLGFSTGACKSTAATDYPVLTAAAAGTMAAVSGTGAPTPAAIPGPGTAGGPGTGSAAGTNAGRAGTGIPAPAPAAVGGTGAAGVGRGASAGTGATAGAAGASASAGRGPVATAGTGPAAMGGGRGGSNAGTGAAGTTSTGATYDPCPKAGEPCKILPLGDSITFGLGYAGSYRVELFRKAHADGKSITFTGSLSNGPAMVDGVTFPQANEGHSGWKINQLLPLIPAPALQPLPHIILLMIGTNDIAQNDDVANAPKRLGGLLDKLIMTAPDALIVVANLTPLSFGGAVETYNKALPAVIDERAMAGKHIQLVDVFTGFQTSMLADGVHPNKEGSDRMAGVFYAAIGGVLH